ncbi:MAG: allantoinase [Ktedonobacteraceae bacterium]
MSTYDLLVRGGILVSANGLHQADLAVSAGRIVAIEPELSGTSREEIDARGLHIFPGCIDAHVHFNEPGRTTWEGFASGSRALAAGGATSFFDMPLNSSPPTLRQADFLRKHEAAQASSLLDFALWGGLTPNNLDALEELAECGVIGFKAFMSNSGLEEFPAVDDLTLYEGMQQAARLGKIVAVHAENEQITSNLACRAIAEGRTGVQDYLNSRPVIAELEAIARTILFASETGCALHIVHVSTGRGVQLVVEARARGVNVTCETCPHYLALNEEDMLQLGAVAKCAPPLRSQTDQDDLWQHLLAGTIQLVASDHSPATPEMKTSTNFFQIWGGISGCQSLLHILLTEGHEQRALPLPAIAALTAEHVAQRFGLANRKGRLAIDMDADFVLVDVSRHEVLHTHDLFYRHQQSPYVGRILRGGIVRTLVRGITVFRDGQQTSTAGGRLLIPDTHTI